MSSKNITKQKLDQPLEVADGIYWVGYYDEKEALHCNPYLIIEGDEAVLIDGGSRPDFSTVMIMILQTGIHPSMIKRLIYQHYDPDLCGSIPHLEEIINSESLRILSHKENNIFIKYYGCTTPRLCIESKDMKFTFKTGRTLRFILTPYAHSAGSFTTYDEQTGTLFSSDLFGGYGTEWQPFMKIETECYGCSLPASGCPNLRKSCIFDNMIDFHRRIMSSTNALKYAMRKFREFDIKLIAPQHGSMIDKPKDISFIMDSLEELDYVGIDRYLKA